MRRAVVALVCAAIPAALPSPALAQTPTNGQLAVVLNDRIVAVNADGSAPRSLYAPGSGDAITGPAWSPDGNKLAFSYQRKITVLDLATRTSTSLTEPGADGRDVEPTWSADGKLIGFRRIRGATHQRLKVTLQGAPLSPLTLDYDADAALALAPDLDTYALRLGNLLYWSGSDLEIVLGASGTPAWSRDATKLAYVDVGPVWQPGLRFRTFAGTARNVKVADPPVAAPRWAPTGDRLTYLRNGEVMTVAATEPPTPPAVVPGLANATAVDWQPCTAATTIGCRSVLPPVCSATTAQVTTQADQPVELPPAPCTDPAGLPLQFLASREPEHGSLTGMVYTPRPGFVGQDSVTYRVSNGSAQSDPVRVTVFVVPRPVTLSPAPGANPPATAAAPFLSLRARPRLDRKRSTLARLSCDQACSFTVRLEGKLRKKGKAVKGKAVKRTLAAGSVLALRLKLPAKPKGTFKTVFITGTVRGANGASRPVKLPVTVRR